MKSTSSITPITLGTVQLGQAYGIANQHGMPRDDEAMAVLDAAWNGGVRSFDTARVYGQAEARIGAWMTARGHRPFLITKVEKMVDDHPCGPVIQENLARSMAELRVDFLDGLMMHSAADLFRPGAIDSLNQLIADGKIDGFGISAYHPEDVDRALEVPGLAMIQVPFNVFDRRMEKSGTIARCKAAGITVFARSLFLQGLFFLDPKTLPEYLAEAAKPLRQLHALAHEMSRTVAEIALVAVRDTPGVSSVVVGAERAEQIREILTLSAAAPLSEDIRETVFHIGAHLPERIYHPGLWKKYSA